MRNLFLLLASALLVACLNGPAAALTTKEKMTTCKFGADDQKLQGKARTAFMSKCMANEKAGKPAARKPAA